MRQIREVATTTSAPLPPEASLWTAYREGGDLEARSALLERHLGLVYLNARRMSARVGSDAVAFDDLVGAGTLGLVQAVEAFDPTLGYAFSTYAMRRIHGAMLDELRSRDWRPRSVRRRERVLRAVVSDLERALGRPPEQGEIADALGITVEEYWRLREDSEGGQLLRIDSREGEGGGTLASVGQLPDTESPTPFTALEHEDQVKELARLLRQLTPRERTVLALSFYEELTLKDIAALLHVSESRVCQIRSKALERLREGAAAGGDAG